MELELRHLRNLCAIAQAGSFNRAAVELGLPQPALSRQIQRLEKRLGGALFHRGRHGVRPTRLGATVLCYADSIIGVFDEIDVRLRHERLLRRRGLRVGWQASYLHIPLLRALRSMRGVDELRIVTTDSSHELDDLLRAGQLDLAIRQQCGRRPEPCGTHIVDVPLAANPLFAVLPATHPLAARPSLRMADLSGETWVSSNGPDDCHGWLTRLCAPFGFTPRIGYDIPVCGPRDEMIAQQGCVDLSQSLRPVPSGVVHRPIVDLTVQVYHTLAYRLDCPMADRIPELAASVSTAHWELVRRRPQHRDWWARQGCRHRPWRPAPALTVAGR